MASRRIRNLLGLLLWVGLVTYLIFAVRYCRRERSEQLCRGVKASVVDDNRRGFITEEIVKRWYAESDQNPVGKPLSKVNTLKMRDIALARGYVKSAKAYTASDGFLHIEVTQRIPMLRIMPDDGRSIYITDDWHVVPTQLHYSADVPIITGDLTLPFDRNFIGEIKGITRKKDEKKIGENYIFLYKLFNFVKFLDDDPFWKSQFVQINVLGNSELVLIPRVGDQTILLGTLDRYAQKLNKLADFYTQGLRYVGWEKCYWVNLKYKNQVVCRWRTDPKKN